MKNSDKKALQITLVLMFLFFYGLSFLQIGKYAMCEQLNGTPANMGILSDGDCYHVVLVDCLTDNEHRQYCEKEKLKVNYSSLTVFVG